MAGFVKAEAFGDVFPVFVPDGSSNLVNLRGDSCKDLQAGLRDRIHALVLIHPFSPPLLCDDVDNLSGHIDLLHDIARVV